MAQFLDKSVSEDTITKIAHQCSFKEMAKCMSKFSVGDLKFLQKGEIGDWKNTLHQKLKSALRMR